MWLEKRWEMVSGHDADQLWACLISLTKGTQYVTLMWRKLKTSLKTAMLHSGKCRTSPVLCLLWHKAHFSNKWNRRHVYRRDIPDTGIVMLMLVSTLSWIPLHKTTPIPMNCSYKMNSPTKPQYCVFEQHYGTKAAVPFKHILYHSVSWCISKYYGITTECYFPKGMVSKQIP